MPKAQYTVQVGRVRGMDPTWALENVPSLAPLLDLQSQTWGSLEQVLGAVTQALLAEAWAQDEFLRQGMEEEYDLYPLELHVEIHGPRGVAYVFQIFPRYM